MSYQRITGSIMANSHPGSYCGQDAYNDMFVTEGVLDVDELERRASFSNLDNEQCWGGGKGCLIKKISML